MQITAGNASGINDGAAALFYCQDEAKSRHIEPVAESSLGLGQVSIQRSWVQDQFRPAAKREKAGWSAELDLVEANELSPRRHAVNKDLGWDVDKVNLGSAIAIGHPIGASEARVLLPIRDAETRCQKGLATLCIDGMGIAMCVERD